MKFYNRKSFNSIEKSKSDILMIDLYLIIRSIDKI